jgi:hypothetical protein
VVAVGATRVGIDALGGLLAQFADAETVRRELHRIAAGLRPAGRDHLVTMERTDEDGGVGRWGVEEFVADNVILLRNRLEHEKRRRTVEILKFRGATHHKGEYPFTIDSEDGVTIIPLSAIELKQHSSDIRVSSGVPETRQDVLRRHVPRLDHPGQRRHRHRQDADGLAVHQGRHRGRRARAAVRPPRKAASSWSATPRRGASTSRRPRATACCASSAATPR